VHVLLGGALRQKRRLRALCPVTDIHHVDFPVRVGHSSRPRYVNGLAVAVIPRAYIPIDGT